MPDPLAVASVAKPRLSRVLASGVPVESMRDQVSPSAVQTAGSRPAPELCHDPTSAAAAAASAPASRSPAPQPPKGENQNPDLQRRKPPMIIK